MRIRLASTSIALTVALIAPAALAQVIGGGNPQVKTPPLANSQMITVPTSIHVPFVPPFPVGWAGAITKIHLLDAAELDVDLVHPIHLSGGGAYKAHLPGSLVVGPNGNSFPLISPFGPHSANLQSVPLSITQWHPNAQGSGIGVAPSQLIPLGQVRIHVKQTSPALNSDVDATFKFWNIWHIRPGGTSAPLRLDASDQFWVRSTITNVGQLHTAGSGLAPGGPTPFSPTAHWLHITNPVTFHLIGNPGSQFYATFVGTVGLGIEHVPEPASGLLVGGGILALAFGGRARQRRLRMA